MCVVHFPIFILFVVYITFWKESREKVETMPRIEHVIIKVAQEKRDS